MLALVKTHLFVFDNLTGSSIQSIQNLPSTPRLDNLHSSGFSNSISPQYWGEKMEAQKVPIGCRQLVPL